MLNRKVEVNFYPIAFVDKLLLKDFQFHLLSVGQVPLEIE